MNGGDIGRDYAQERPKQPPGLTCSSSYTK